MKRHPSYTRFDETFRGCAHAASVRWSPASSGDPSLAETRGS